MRKNLTSALAVAAALLTTLTGTAEASDTVVRTDSGPVRGLSADGYRTFHGIPYAAPPTGALRWRAPRPPSRWTAVKDATRPGNRCAQTAGANTPSTDEDCLVLNVTAPAARGRLKPVMVWLHGGGNSFGTASDNDTRRLAAGGDAVVVSPNYRLGVFSSFGHASQPGSGDFGLQDQQAALRWVRHNAAAFGGDPRNVTLIGESGGAFDVCGQLTSPGSAGLFQRAIMHSGSCSSAWPVDAFAAGGPAVSPWRSTVDRDTQGAALAAKFGCAGAPSVVDCLRGVPAADLIALPQASQISPLAYGTPTLPLRPDTALAAGLFHRVPVLTGNTRDEGAFTAGFIPGDFDESTYQAQLVKSFGADAPRVAARYPSAKYGSPRLAWTAVITDGSWTCHQLDDARRLALGGSTYSFEFADENAPQGFFAGLFAPGFPARAFHSSDMAYLFDTPGFPLAPAQRRLADQMIRYWGRFAASGDPNGQGLPRWQPLRDANSQALVPDATHAVDLASEHQCGFWAARG
ncbi:carboxylesterase/lipase family protein [Amycolatopsis minnesotensis]|uniref:Carboxylic ester hydrolase n=1 Tax=Amycolatopsis minnesotensis TaxID=337894 RepID=A0ABP5C233_9PSEU